VNFTVVLERAEFAAYRRIALVPDKDTIESAAGTPAPVTAIPTTTPLAEESVILLLPAATVAVGVTSEIA
jgi:hypothetical protein